MNAEELLRKGLREIHVSCSEDQVQAFMTHLRELKKWNRVHNLTALKTDSDIIIRHFLDSLLYLKALPEKKIRLADAGTGAGFPGIPIKIARPGTHVALIEPARKKAAFLRHVIRMLHMGDIIVLADRLEHLGKEHARRYHVIVTRAVFSLRDFLETACPYVVEGGRIIAGKGPNVFDELKTLEADTHLGNSVKEVRRLRLPFGQGERNLVVMECGRMPPATAHFERCRH